MIGGSLRVLQLLQKRWDEMNTHKTKNSMKLLAMGVAWFGI
jgi:hypothetical protein